MSAPTLADLLSRAGRTVVAVDLLPGDSIASVVLSDGVTYATTVVPQANGLPIRRVMATVDGTTLRISRRPTGLIVDGVERATNLSELPDRPYQTHVSDTVIPVASMTLLPIPETDDLR